MQPDIENMTVTELKALAFDCIGIIEQQKSNLQVLNQKIAEKDKPVVKKEIKSAS